MYSYVHFLAPCVSESALCLLCCCGRMTRPGTMVAKRWGAAFGGGKSMVPGEHRKCVTRLIPNGSLNRRIASTNHLAQGLHQDSESPNQRGMPGSDLRAIAAPAGCRRAARGRCRSAAWLRETAARFASQIAPRRFCRQVGNTAETSGIRDHASGDGFSPKERTARLPMAAPSR